MMRRGTRLTVDPELERIEARVVTAFQNYFQLLCAPVRDVDRIRAAEARFQEAQQDQVARLILRKHLH